MKIFKIPVSYNFLDQLVPGEKYLELKDDDFNSGQLFGIRQGMAGKCLSLLQIYELTGNKLYLLLANQLYINLVDNWDKLSQSWIDHSLHIQNIDQHFEHIQQFRVGNKDFFSRKKMLDNSFENGISGIAYTLNKYEKLTKETRSKEQEIPISTLLPKESIEIQLEIDNQLIQNLRFFSWQKLTNLWIKHLFPTTLQLEKGNHLLTFSYDCEISNNWKYSVFYTQLECYIRQNIYPNLDPSALNEFTKIIEYDHTKNLLELGIKNRALERGRELYINSILPNILSLSNEELLRRVYCQLNQNLTPLEVDESNYTILLYQTDGILDIDINTFEYIFLSNYEDSKTGLTALNNIAREQGIDVKEKNIRKKSIDFLRKMIFLKVLIPLPIEDK